MAKGSNGDGLRPITVRLPPDVMEALQDMSRRCLLSKAEIMRILVTRNLGRHLEDIRIADEDEAAEIRRQITELFDATSRAENELHRIQLLYDQEIKMIQIREKYGDAAVPFGTENGNMALPLRAINEVIDRYENATKQAGDTLCRLLM